MKKNLLLFNFLFLCFLISFAQIPAGYYNSALGKKQAELKTALHLIIKNAKVPSYGSGSNSTWAAFAKMDVRPEDGTVWDMYSNNHVPFNGNSAASGMNIEHSFAKSWWGGGRQAAQDVQHLAPSNITANSSKGSWPMAVVDGKITYSNGCIKVGKSSSKPGMTLDAWEPADEYKGDFARMYMYMVTAYEDYASDWTANSVNQLDNNTYPVFEQWTIDLLLKWNRQDPVSQKEKTRTNEAYKIQGNRNPFIDYPQLAEYIWGNKMSVPFSVDGNTDYPYLSTPENNFVLDFGKVVLAKTVVMPVQIQGANLTGDLTVGVGGDNANEFTIPVTKISKANAEAGYSLPVSFLADNIGEKEAELTISGGGITPVIVILRATPTDEFIALPATNISATSFTANWTSSANADGYKLNVYSMVSTTENSAQTILNEDFDQGLPVSWQEQGYIENTSMSSCLRLGSGKDLGSIITPDLDLSGNNISLNVDAKQYSGDNGAELKVFVDGQEVETWATEVGMKKFSTIINNATSKSKISLTAQKGRRVYVDKVEIKKDGASKTEASISGYPVNLGNVNSYTVTNLSADSLYYYTVTPIGNDTEKSNEVTVRTTVLDSVNPGENNPIHYLTSSNGIHLFDIISGSVSGLRVYNMTGHLILADEIDNSGSYDIPLSTSGIYFIQLITKSGSKTLKVMY